jgi:aspartate carbamoyltransferase catalytic subunit
MHSLAGPIRSLAVGVTGDLSMRATRSLLRAFTVLPPKSIRLMAPHARRGDAAELVVTLGSRVAWGEPGDLTGLDLLYVGGLPAGGAGGALDAQARAAFAFGGEARQRLPLHALVLSPMPVIDEISADARHDARIRIFEQNRLGQFIRMALLLRALSMR